ncbi:MarR family winged helix-turn-helix transcriptional regulator [Microbacterium sp. DT81.1]|uniref:MarR family winged helix-turn-helix transcriptional regulator n=1 Tax=Microbacterium sp. DT81.1 TaxID=3393413 RepID=UPI003CE6C819
MADVMRDFMARAVLFQDAVARYGGINSTDMQAVGLLMSEGPATPGELAERTGMTAGGAITAVIDRLERAGYVTRQRDGADRRRVIVTAVPETVLAKVGPIYGRIAARWADYLETLSDEQLQFAEELFTRATEINREETQALRGTP